MTDAATLRFLAVEWLWALWAVPLVGLVLWYAEDRAGRRLARSLGAHGRSLVERFRGRALSAGLLLAGLASAVLALARPAWGHDFEEVRSRGTDLVVVLDASRSMLTRDAAPDRLTRAKIALGRLLDLLEERGGHRVGLVAFAGTTSVRSPLTLDLDYVRDRLRQLSPETMPRGGTVLGDAIRRAVDQLAERGDTAAEPAILLLTDGEDHESFPIEAAREAGAAGIPVHAVGIGDPSAGGRVPVGDETGAFVQYGGQTVISKLDEATLLEVARVSGGAYVPAGTRAIPLDRLYEDVLVAADGGLRDVRRERRPIERHGAFVFLALALVIASRSATRVEGGRS